MDGKAREQRHEREQRYQQYQRYSGGPGDSGTTGRLGRRAMEERPYGGAEAYSDPALREAGIDLLGMDLESLRTVRHPVLSALVSDLRERVAAPGSEALWGFDNDTP